MQSICESLCGLVIEDPEKGSLPVPLTGVTVNVKILDLTAQVCIEQRYVNKESIPIEAVYKFPLDEGAALCKFTAEVDGRVIEGVVKETETAQAEYQEAIQSGHSAFLVEEKLPDVFKAKVGNLAPGSGAKIRLTYYTELKTEGEEIRFFLPTTIAPRYVPASDKSSAAADLASIPYINESKYKVEITADVKMTSNIEAVRCPTHSVDTRIHDQKKSAVVSLSCESVAMDRDWVIYVKTAEPHKPRYVAEKSSDGTWALALSLVPQFSLGEQKTELIFVVDRSGSMQGQGIEQARQAMTFFLHSLPADCYVNIVGFGFSFQSLYPQSRKYSDEVLTESKKHVQELDANLGGTEIYAPLEWVFQQPAVPEYLRQVFILTDGEVSNADQVLSLVARNQHSARVFALGLGSSASHHLVEGIARAGNGTALFASLEERLEKKVLQQLQDALQPALTDVSVTWEGLRAEREKPQVELETEKTLLGYGKPIKTDAPADTKVQEVNVRQAPSKCPPVFDGRHLVVYALLDKSIVEPPAAAELSAVSPVGPLKARVTLSERIDDDTIHRLAARKLIQERQDRVASLFNTEEIEPLKKEIISLGCQYGLASRYTSFVAVDPKEQKSLKESLMMMKTRDVPNTVAYGWGGFAPQGRCMPPAMNYCMPMAMACSAPAPAPMMLFGAADMSADCDFRMMLKSRARKARPAAPSDVVYCRAESGGFADSIETGGAHDISFPESVPGSVPVEEKKAETDDDKLMQLVALQKFSGSFNFDPLLAKLLQVTADELQQAGEQLGFQDMTVWATLVALAYMSVALDKLQDSWRLVCVKAVKWLVSVNVDEKEARQKAENFVRTKLAKV